MCLSLKTVDISYSYRICHIICTCMSLLFSYAPGHHCRRFFKIIFGVIIEYYLFYYQGNSSFCYEEHCTCSSFFSLSSLSFLSFSAFFSSCCLFLSSSSFLSISLRENAQHNNTSHIKTTCSVLNIIHSTVTNYKSESSLLSCCT